MADQNNEIVFSVTSGFGANTEQAYVQMLIEAADWMTQMPPEAARELALNLLTAAEAADGDGFLMGFLKDNLGVENVQHRANILIAFRTYRDEHRLQDEEHKRRSLFPSRMPGENHI